MAITNLTGYTWVGNDVLTFTALGSIDVNRYYLNYTIAGLPELGTYSELDIIFDIDGDFTGSEQIFVRYQADIVYTVDNGWKSPPVLNTSFKTIQITGGTDATNSTLIAWLQANGTLTPPSPAGYEVTFVTNGGTSVTKLEDVEELPTPLPTPTKSGYTFNGWYYESNFTTQAQTSDTLSANVTLYAKWTLNTYTITFEENGGSTVTDLTEQTALSNPLPTTTKDNHVFAGWYLDSSFTQKAVAGATIESNVTLYAKWYTPTTWCEDIADAIREKDETTEPIKHLDFPERILAIDIGIDVSDANAVVGDVLTGKTFYAVDDTKKTGTMADNGTVNTDITTKAQEVTIAGGKHSGSGKVKISTTEQAKIIADNIKSGVSILGQAGGLTPAKEEETKTVTPDFSSGNVVVTPTSGKVLSQVTITKDSNLITNNIKKDVTVHGITGSSFIAIELTQAQYDALSVYDDNTYYLIVEE